MSDTYFTPTRIMRSEGRLIDGRHILKLIFDNNDGIHYWWLDIGDECVASGDAGSLVEAQEQVNDALRAYLI